MCVAMASTAATSSPRKRRMRRTRHCTTSSRPKPLAAIDVTNVNTPSVGPACERFLFKDGGFVAGLADGPSEIGGRDHRARVVMVPCPPEHGQSAHTKA